MMPVLRGTRDQKRHFLRAPVPSPRSRIQSEKYAEQIISQGLARDLNCP
jgi:hypothetical protein